MNERLRQRLRRRTGRFACLLVLGLAWSAAHSSARGESPGNDAGEVAPKSSFSREIAPILLQKCQKCHGPEKAKAGLRVDTFERLMKGNKEGKRVIAPGMPNESKLYQLIVTDDEDDRMPQKGAPLSIAEIGRVRNWIRDGARFDGPDPGMALAALVPAAAFPPPPEVYPNPLPITALGFMPGGSNVVVGGYHELLVWDLGGKLLERVAGLPERVQALAKSPHGNLWAAAAGSPGRIGQIDLIDFGAEKPAVRTLGTIPDAMLCVVFSPDGKKVIGGGADSSIRIYDVTSGREERVIQQHADWVLGLAVSPDGTRIASASRDRSARVYDSGTGDLLTAYMEHEAPVYAVAFYRDGDQVISAGQDGRIQIWGAADGKRKRQFGGLGGDPLRMELSGDDLFCGGMERKVREFSAKMGSQEHAWEAPTDWVFSLAIDRQRNLLAAGGAAGRVRVWDLASGQQRADWVAMPLSTARVSSREK